MAGGLGMLPRFLVFAMVITMPASAQHNSPYYVPVSEAAQPGKAPLMKAQLITKPGEQPQQYAVIFGKGDEVASGLVEFAQKHNITSAHFTGIGALHDVTVAWMDRTRKEYKAIPIPQQVEVLSLIGDIAAYQGKPAVHTHLVVGLEDGTAKGGHLIEAHVFPTLEVMVTVDPVGMQKQFDPETGLALISPQP